MHIRELLNKLENNMQRKSYENLETKATEIVKDASVKTKTKKKTSEKYTIYKQKNKRSRK